MAERGIIKMADAKEVVEKIQRYMDEKLGMTTQEGFVISSMMAERYKERLMEETFEEEETDEFDEFDETPEEEEEPEEDEIEADEDPELSEEENLEEYEIEADEKKQEVPRKPVKEAEVPGKPVKEAMKKVKEEKPAINHTEKMKSLLKKPSGELHKLKAEPKKEEKDELSQEDIDKGEF